MLPSKRPISVTDYTDSEGVKHRIHEYGHPFVVYGTHGVSTDYMPDEIYIDGQRWAGLDDLAVGNPVEQAKSEIEDRIKKKSASQP